MSTEKNSKLMLAIMLGKKPKPAPDEEEEGEDSGGDLRAEGLHSAMQDLLDAIHQSDVDAMADAFEDAVKLSDDDKEPQDGDDEEEEGPSLGDAFKNRGR